MGVSRTKDDSRARDVEFGQDSLQDVFGHDRSNPDRIDGNDYQGFLCVRFCGVR